MIGRMFGALFLRSATYEEVEHDKKAIWQAAFIVILVSAATVGGEILAGEETVIWWSLTRGVIRGVGSWAIWALCTWLIGIFFNSEIQTEADWGQLARTIGFAQTPGILNIFTFLATVGGIIYIVTYLWTIVCVIVAVRQSLDYTTTFRAISVIVIAAIPVAFLFMIVLGLTGGLDFNATGLEGMDLPKILG